MTCIKFLSHSYGYYDFNQHWENTPYHRVIYLCYQLALIAQDLYNYSESMTTNKAHFLILHQNFHCDVIKMISDDLLRKTSMSYRSWRGEKFTSELVFLDIITLILLMENRQHPKNLSVWIFHKDQWHAKYGQEWWRNGFHQAQVYWQISKRTEKGEINFNTHWQISLSFYFK